MQIISYDSHAPITHPSEAEEFADAHMRGNGARDNVLIVVGCCCVEYYGRARSTLGWGERIVIVKPDGSVLVHQMAGPVNWQPPGTRVQIPDRNRRQQPSVVILCCDLCAGW